MPTLRTSHDLATVIERVGRAAQHAQREAVFRASMILKNSTEAELLRATGGDGRLRNLRGRNGQPIRLSLGFNIQGTNNPTALLIARGPWGIVEYGSTPHPITPKLAKTGRGRGVSRSQRNRLATQRELNRLFGGRGTYAGLRPLPVANGIYRYSARHPGSKAKQPWKRGMTRAMPRAVNELHAVIRSRVGDVVRSGRETYTYVRGETGT